MVESNPHWEKVRRTASNAEQTLPPVIEGADSTHKGAQNPIIVEDLPQDSPRDEVECLP